MKKKKPALSSEQLEQEILRRQAQQEPEQEPEDDSVDNFDELPRGLGLYEDEA
jgi:hypothetical protein